MGKLKILFCCFKNRNEIGSANAKLKTETDERKDGLSDNVVAKNSPTDLVAKKTHVTSCSQESPTKENGTKECYTDIKSDEVFCDGNIASFMNLTHDNLRPIHSMFSFSTASTEMTNLTIKGNIRGDGEWCNENMVVDDQTKLKPIGSNNDFSILGDKDRVSLNQSKGKGFMNDSSHLSYVSGLTYESDPEKYTNTGMIRKIATMSSNQISNSPNKLLKNDDTFTENDSVSFNPSYGVKEFSDNTSRFNI